MNTVNKSAKERAGINNIARSQGTNKMDSVYYSANAPHNQPFNKAKTLKLK